jgi:hypothetical protein
MSPKAAVFSADGITRHMREFRLFVIFHRLSQLRRKSYSGMNAHAFSMWAQPEFRMKMISLSLVALVAVSAGAYAAPDAPRSISLTQEPLVMRLDKNEFRIAFGINGERCGANGCSGMIRYRVEWKTRDGLTRSEIKHVNYTVSPSASRTIAVDRQYFDTAEGQHTTDVVKVRVDAITVDRI